MVEDKRRLPRHIAIIMDGNGRWARQKGRQRSTGHRAGVAVESTGAIKFNPEVASFGARAGGWAIDTVITTAAALPGAALLIAGSGIMRWLGGALIVVGFCLTTRLYAIAVSSTGQWIGNRMM